MSLDLISVSLQQAVTMTGISYTKLYDDAKRGILRSRRNGKKYIVKVDDLREYVDSLPSGSDEQP